MTETPEHAGVIAPPPILLLIAIMAGLGLSWLAPLGVLAHIPGIARYAIGGALIGLGVAVSIRAVSSFRAADTAVRPWIATSSLVTSGLFERVRNPMYVGMVVMALGFAVFAAADWLVHTAAALAVALHYGVVVREERYLEAIFGDDYRAYKERVKRYWVI